MKEINILASVKRPNSDRGNLGDLFGFVLLEHLCEPFNIKVNRLGIYDDIENNTFALVGSICHLCNKKAKDKRLLIIGCGIIKPDTMTWTNKNIIWKGVRGPKTLERIHQRCPIISDPGLLISNVFPLRKNVHKKKIGYIIHSVDREQFFKLFPETK